MGSMRIVLHIRSDDLAGAVDAPSHQDGGENIVDASQGHTRAGVEPAADLHVSGSTRTPSSETGQPPMGHVADTTKTVYVRVPYEPEEEVGGASSDVPLGSLGEKAIVFHTRRRTLPCCKAVCLYRGSCTSPALRTCGAAEMFRGAVTNRRLMLG